MFSCEHCEIFKNSFLYKTPMVTASIRTINRGAPRTPRNIVDGELWNNRQRLEAVNIDAELFILVVCGGP